MDWRHNLLILERILCCLELPDLKSASLVCKAWLQASPKAFEATSRVVVFDPQPDDGPGLEHLLHRFHRIKEFKFKLGEGGAAPNGLLADLPLEVSSSMTTLILDYTPTADTLKAINIFLSQLTTKFPALEELYICPNADPPEDLVSPSPSAEFLEHTSVPNEEHSNLRVLRVPVGPNSGSGIAWSFLKSLKNLAKLDLLKFHVQEDDLHLKNQLAAFTKHFPAEAQISKLNVYLRLGFRMIYLNRTNVLALESAFQAIKPQTCTLYIQQVDKECEFVRGVQISHFASILEALLSATLKRIDIYDLVPLTSFTHPNGMNVHIFSLVDSLRYYQHPEHSAHVLLHIDICAAEAGSPPISYLELECTEFCAPLFFRHGPVGEYAELFELFFVGLLKQWLLDSPDINWPVPKYKALRKYSFGENQEILQQAQLYPAEDKSDEIIIPFFGRPSMVHSFGGPGYWIWKETEFTHALYSSALVNARPSWKQQEHCSKSTNPALPVAELHIYSLD